MISNQILQTTLDGLKAITRIDLGICDTEGKVLASTFTDAEESESSVLAFVDSPADSQVIQGYQFFKVFDENDDFGQESDEAVFAALDDAVTLGVNAFNLSLGIITDLQL